MPGVLRTCLQDLTSRWWPRNCNLVPAKPLVYGPRAEVTFWNLLPGRQSWSQHLTDLVWHNTQFRLGGSAVLAIGLVFFMVRTVSYVRHRRRMTLTVAAPPPRREHYRYLQMQGRRLLAVMFMLFSAGSVYGMYKVFDKGWPWRIGFGVLAVVISWSLYTTMISLLRPGVTSKSHAEALKESQPGGVDVFIPVCGEDLEVVLNTIEHAVKMDWGGPAHVHVLDDSKKEDPLLRQLAAGRGVFYLRRPNRGEFKKAGNLNYAASQTFREFIVVFDADFAPAREFLSETMPYFSDPSVGIVQTTQYFSTCRRDTANWLARVAGIIQGMFFCWSQPGMQSIDSAMCVGTNVLYRRSALEAAGGFVNISGGEDVITGVEFLNAGYKTTYVPLNLARGLCPDNFAGAVNQQYRWCLTTLALVAPVKGIERVCDGFWGCRMKPLQRAAFLAGLLYYAQSVLMLVTAVLPSLIMLWVFPYEVGPGNYLPIAPAMLGMLFLPLMIPGWRFEVMRLSAVYAVAHLLAVLDALTGRVAPWVPSGASGKSKTPMQAAVILRGWVLLTQGLAWWALIRDVKIYHLPAYWPAIALTLIQSVIFFPLLLPGYGTVPVFRRMRAYLSGQFHRSAGISPGPVEMELLPEPARRGESGNPVLYPGERSPERVGAGTVRDSGFWDL